MRKIMIGKINIKHNQIIFTGSSRENCGTARKIGARKQKAIIQERGEQRPKVLLEFIRFHVCVFSFLAAQSNNIDVEDIFQHVSILQLQSNEYCT